MIIGGFNFQLQEKGMPAYSPVFIFIVFFDKKLKKATRI